MGQRARVAIGGWRLGAVSLVAACGAFTTGPAATDPPATPSAMPDPAGAPPDASARETGTVGTFDPTRPATACPPVAPPACGGTPIPLAFPPETTPTREGSADVRIGGDACRSTVTTAAALKKGDSAVRAFVALSIPQTTASTRLRLHQRITGPAEVATVDGEWSVKFGCGVWVIGQDKRESELRWEVGDGDLEIDGEIHPKVDDKRDNPSGSKFSGLTKLPTDKRTYDLLATAAGPFADAGRSWVGEATVDGAKKPLPFIPLPSPVADLQIRCGILESQAPEKAGTATFAMTIEEIELEICPP